MGTIKKHNDGWRVWWDLGPDPVTGKRRQRTKTVPTFDAAERFLADRETERREGMARDPQLERTRLGDFIGTYLEARRVDLRPSSWESIRSRLHTHVQPHLGQRRVSEVTGDELSVFYARLLETVSPSTVRKVNVELKTMFNHAIRWKYRTDNPCSSAIIPPHTPQDPVVWTADQAARLFVAVEQHPLRVAYLLAAATGMRRGEVCGLRWEDVDLEAGELHVRQTRTEVGGRIVVGEPKSKRGRRTILLASEVVQVLRTERRTQAEDRLLYGPDWQGDGLVVCEPDGRGVRPGKLSKGIHGLARAAGLPDIRFHDLRHTWGTLAVASGVDPKTVSDSLGHASVRFTLDTYVSRTAEEHQSAAERIADIYMRGV